MMNSADPTKIRYDTYYDLYSKTCNWLTCIDKKMKSEKFESKRWN
jgi:hypothetical protein